MNVKTLRTMQRIIHLFGASMIGFSLYSGAITTEPWLGIIRFIVFPVLAASGLVLWFAPKIIRSTRQGTR